MTFPRAFAFGLFVTLGTLAGCATNEDTSASVESSDSDYVIHSARLLGTIEPGETKAGYYYTPPQKRAWAFTANAGDVVTVTVKSDVGDALAYLTDGHYNVLAYNDDDPRVRGTHDAKIVYTLPKNLETSDFRIVFSDYDMYPAPFDVTLTITKPSSTTCNPKTEPNHIYVGTPEQCLTLHYECKPGQVTFSNACGCGCETLP